MPDPKIGTVEELLAEAIQPFVGLAVDGELMQEITQAVADATGYETNCKWSERKLHFEVRSNPPLLFVI